MPIPFHRLIETKAPDVLPLALEEVKLHLRIDHDADNELINALIGVAREVCENTTGLSLINRDYTLTLDSWPGTPQRGWWDGMREGADLRATATELPLPRPPLANVQQILVYADDDSVETFSGYYVDTLGLPGRIVLRNNTAPPMPTRAAHGIEIIYSAGYGTHPENIPSALRQGMKQLVAHLYENRGDSADQALEKSGAAVLFQPFRMMRLA